MVPDLGHAGAQHLVHDRQAGLVRVARAAKLLDAHGGELAQGHSQRTAVGDRQPRRDEVDRVDLREGEVVAVLDEQVAHAGLHQLLPRAWSRELLGRVHDERHPGALVVGPANRLRDLERVRADLLDDLADAPLHVLAQVRPEGLVLAQQVLHRHRGAREAHLDSGHLQALEDVEHARADARLVPRVGQEAATPGLQCEATDDGQQEIGHVWRRRELVELAVVDRDARDRVLVAEHPLQPADLRGLADAHAAGETQHDRAIAPGDLLDDLEDRIVHRRAVAGRTEDVDVPALRLELSRLEVLGAERRDLV